MRSAFWTFWFVVGAIAALANHHVDAGRAFLGALNITLALYWAQPKVAK